jgi:hypothetical protein
MSGTRLSIVLLLVVATLLVHPGGARSFTHPKSWPPSASPAGLAVTYHDVNSVRLAVSNTGQIGNDLLTDEGAGFWPRHTANGYVFGTGLWIGALADLDGDGERDTLFIQAYDPLSGGSEFREGRADQSPDDPLATIYKSTDSLDLSLWPEEFWATDDDPESPTFGQRVPLVLSDQDFVTIYTTVGKSPIFATPSPPLEVRQRSLAFRSGPAGNVIFFIFDIENLSERMPTGPFSLEEAYLGFDADVDIGTEDTDDRTSCFQMQENLETPELGDSIPINMGFAWDEDFDESNFVGAPGFIGIACIQSPGNDYDGIDNDGDGMTDESPFNAIDDDADGEIDDQPDEVDQFGLVNYTFHNQPIPPPLIRTDPEDDPMGYRMMACDPPDECVEISQRNDVRFMISSGPFTMRPGETHRLVIAFVFANAVGDPTDIEVYGDPPRPDPNDSVFSEFLRTKRIAQAAYDLGFLVAAAPPMPHLTLLPGDRQVTVLWDESPVASPDPRYSEFVRYDAGYREYDFEGFRLWRSVTGKFSTAGDPRNPLNPIARARNEENPGLDLTILGQWDLADGITTESHGILVTDSVVLETGDVVIIEADTFDLGEDTGLRFSFVDRGEPAVPLTNGLRYYYCVESYDYNSALFPTSPLSVASGIEFIAETSAMPRSNATSFAAAGGSLSHVDAEGNVLPDETPETFVHADPPAATDALTGSILSIFDDESIEDTHHDVVIDEIAPDHQEGTALVTFHLEDADGSPLLMSGESRAGFTARYDSTASPAFTTVFNQADTTRPLYELTLDFTMDLEGFRLPLVNYFQAWDREGNDITSTMGAVGIRGGNPGFPLGFRGTDITMTWHEWSTDTLSLSMIDEARGDTVSLVYDTGNRVAVPFKGKEETRGLGWSVDPYAGQPEGRFVILTNGEFQNPSLRMYVSGLILVFGGIQRTPREGDVWLLRQRSYYITDEGDTIPGPRPLVPGTRYRVNLTGGGQDKGEIDLTAIRVVPNPYLGYSEFESGGGARKIQFVNLPSECTIRIYTISGVLVRVLEHVSSEAGTENYDLKTREGLPLASGHYYYHITVPDGRTKLGRFAIIQ